MAYIVSAEQHKKVMKAAKSGKSVDIKSRLIMNHIKDFGDRTKLIGILFFPYYRYTI